MKIVNHLGNSRVVLVVYYFILSGFITSPLCHAELPAGVVPITSEPSHKVLFQNSKVRIIEAQIAKGTKSLFHEHQYDGLYVFFKAEGLGNEPYKGKIVTPNLKSGAVQFVPITGQYIHRVIASKDHDLDISVVECLIPAGVVTTDERFPPFTLALESPRGRIYRLKLNPGDATDTFTRAANTAIFAITPGQISEMSDDKPANTWKFETGNFRWIDTQQELTIKNDGQQPVELVEIEVY